MFSLKKASWISFIISVQGYLFLSWLFIQALLFPLENFSFLYNAAIVILIIEFLNIHSGMILSLYKEKIKKESVLFKPFLLFIYSLFVFFLLIFSDNIYVVIIFFVSLVSKILARRAVPSIFARYQFILFLSILFLSIGGVSLWEHMFPFPQETYEARPQNTSGILVDIPQVILVWGIFYYLLLAGIEFVLFVKELKNQGLHK